MVGIYYQDFQKEKFDSYNSNLPPPQSRQNHFTATSGRCSVWGLIFYDIFKFFHNGRTIRIRNGQQQ